MKRYAVSEEALKGYRKSLAALESVPEAGMDRPGNLWHWEIGTQGFWGRP